MAKRIAMSRNVNEFASYGANFPLIFIYRLIVIILREENATLLLQDN